MTKLDDLKLLGPGAIARRYTGERTPLIRSTECAQCEAYRKEIAALKALISVNKPDVNAPVNKPPVNKPDRRAYYRDLMRARRAAAKEARLKKG